MHALLFRLMTNKLMSEFNMEGKGNKKKRPFKNTKTLELITGKYTTFFLFSQEQRLS